MKKHKNRPKSPADKAAGQKPGPIQGERIQKVLARAGLGSRREIERWIEEGKLRVNGGQVTPGDRLRTGDTLQINGRIVNWAKFSEQPTRVLIYYKPTGEVVTRRDPEGRPVIFTQLPKLKVGRWISVGRLDINTQGLLLVTNNGELAHRMMHPSTEIDREYAVRVFGNITDDIIGQLQQGVELDDGPARFDSIVFAGGEGINKWYRVSVKEGRNRLVRRLWESQDIVVNRLMRIRYGPIILPERLKARTFYELDQKELESLMTFVGLKSDGVLKKPPAKRAVRKH